MNTATKLVLAACAGLVAGGAGMAALNAQTSAPPPAYLVAEVRVNDAEAMKAYGAKVPATLAPYQGVAIARAGKTVPLEGAPLNGGISIFRFPSLEKAQAFWNSPAYREIAPIRQKASTGRIYLVEGLPQ